MQASHLVYECHGQSLRILSGALDMHLDGLSVFARVARKKGIVSNKMCRKLVRVDESFSILRHITRASLHSMVRDLRAEISAHAARATNGSQGRRSTLAGKCRRGGRRGGGCCGRG